MMMGDSHTTAEHVHLYYCTSESTPFFFKASVIVFCISFAQINLKIQTHLYALRASP